jgi:hypothetical protein
VDRTTETRADVADTSRNPEPDVPVPPGGGAGERLREFLAAREVPAEDQTDEEEEKEKDEETLDD